MNNSKTRKVVFIGLIAIAILVLVNYWQLKRAMQTSTEVGFQKRVVRNFQAIRFDRVKKVLILSFHRSKRVVLDAKKDGPTIKRLMVEFDKDKLWVDSRERPCLIGAADHLVFVLTDGSHVSMKASFDNKPPILSPALRSYTLGKTIGKIIDEKGEPMK